MKNYGLNYPKEFTDRKITDVLLGGFKKECAALIPNALRENFLPRGEIQNLGEDKMDCVPRGYNNNGETKFNFLVRTNALPATHHKFLKDYNFLTPNGVEFSDAFVAIKAGNTREGNSLIAPIHAIHKHGLVPKSLMPQLKTFDEHHDKNRITSEVDKIAGYFLELFAINYERVLEEDFISFLIKDMIVVGGYAWPNPINGIYPRTGGAFNHCYLDFALPAFQAFDNYPDAFDGDFIKNLAQNYDQTDFGYRTIITINEYAKPYFIPNSPLKKNFLQKLNEFLRSLIWELFKPRY